VAPNAPAAPATPNPVARTPATTSVSHAAARPRGLLSLVSDLIGAIAS
jgi:hypothetical protein